MNESDPAELPCYDKLTFDSKKDANGAAIVARYQHGANVEPYKCQYCGLWHLTSKTTD